MAALKILLVNLPQIIRIFRLLEARALDKSTDALVKTDLAAIEQSFKEADEKALRSVFNRTDGVRVSTPH
jgi:hypothetical protein